MLQQNRTTLLGYVSRDPVFRAAPDGTPVAQFGLATSRRWKDGDGEVREDTQFHTIVAWGHHAGATERFVKKGQPLQVEGRLRYRKYEHEGTERFVTEIVVSGPAGLVNSLAPGAAPAEAPEDASDGAEIPF